MVSATELTDVHIKIPLAMLSRHGLVAGATGTGKTKTLQLLAEQLSTHGVPVFAADIKCDLSGLSVPGEDNPKIAGRATSVGQDWKATGFPVEFFALGGEGTGIPLRATMSSFGPTLLSKVLGLNDTQESSLGLVFHYADKAGLPLLDLADLRAVVQFLTSDEGKGDLKNLGGLSSATAGVILRELIGFSDQGADAFFGDPEVDTGDFLRTTDDGAGLISLVELSNLQGRPAVFFVTQSPTDVPDEVLAQLGSRVQHQLRAHTPNDAKALKATVNTYPHSAYADLGEVITSLGIGEAVVTVMNERGAPAPVAWTRLRAPESLMGTADAAAMESQVLGSPLYAKYSEPLDRDSAREKLAAKLEAGAAAASRNRTSPSRRSTTRSSPSSRRRRAGSSATS